MTPDPEYLTIAEAAKRLQKPERTVRRWVNRLPPSAILDCPNMARRVRVSALHDLMEGHSATDGQPTESHGQPAPDTGRSTSAELVQALLADIEFLRGQLEAQNVAASELRRLMLADRGELMEVRQQVRLLQAAPQMETEQTDLPDNLPSPSSPDAAAGDEVGAGVVTKPPDAGKPSWWEFWKRGR